MNKRSLGPSQSLSPISVEDITFDFPFSPGSPFFKNLFVKVSSFPISPNYFYPKEVFWGLCGSAIHLYDVGGVVWLWSHEMDSLSFLIHLIFDGLRSLMSWGKQIWFAATALPKGLVHSKWPQLNSDESDFIVRINFTRESELLIHIFWRAYYFQDHEVD